MSFRIQKKKSLRYKKWEQLNASSVSFSIGIDDKENAQKMMWMEFGTGTIPRRPLFALFLAAHRTEMLHLLAQSARALLDNNPTVGENSAKYLLVMIKKKAWDGISPALSPNTPKSPRISPHPLLRTGEMIGSIRSVFRVGQRRR